LERNLAYEADAQTFNKEWQPYETALSDEIAQARAKLPAVKHSQRDLATIANLVSGLGVDGHRADIVILRTARAHAAYAGRDAINEQDILMAAELALPHRLKRHPFQDTEHAMQVLSEKLQQVEQQMQQQNAQQQQNQQSPQDSTAKKVKRG
jgi:Mg-chelatase subunit ChlI